MRGGLAVVCGLEVVVVGGLKIVCGLEIVAVGDQKVVWGLEVACGLEAMVVGGLKVVMLGGLKVVCGLEVAVHYGPEVVLYYNYLHQNEEEASAESLQFHNYHQQ